MNLSLLLSITAIAGTLAAIGGYLLMHKRFSMESARGQKREEELARKVYEVEILREIGERIGYSLSAARIIEIISGSLGVLLRYSTVSHLIISEEGEKILFKCQVDEKVSSKFIADVKTKMLAAASLMLGEPLTDFDLEESIEGMILDETNKEKLASFFNLPIIISGRVIGLINVASREPDLYNEENTEVLYRIAHKASEAVTKLQEVLENEEARLVQAVESLTDGLLMVDTNYQVIIANRRLCQILAIIENPKIFDVVNALSGKFDIRSKMEEAIARQLPPESEEISIRDKILQVTVSRVNNRGGNKPMGVVVSFHDITGAKQLERLREDFGAMMVHELRSPLTSIKSTAEMLKETDLTKISKGELAKSLEVIDATSLSMLTLVNDLLDVAKMEAGKFDVICEEGDLERALVEKVEAYRVEATAKRLKLTLKIDGDLPQAWFDKVRIKQVLNNLLSNAVKYTQSGEIAVRAQVEKVGDQIIDILVSVSDTGIGIEPEKINNLFSKFGQLKAGRGIAGLKSTGLGLYIARSIVEAWEGRIWVESRGSGMGSIFYFTVPIAARGNEKSMAGNEKFLKKPNAPNFEGYTVEEIGQA